MTLAAYELALLALAVGSLALLGVVGVIAWLVVDYRASRSAGKIVQAARQALAPTTFPRRPKHG